MPQRRKPTVTEAAAAHLAKGESYWAGQNCPEIPHCFHFFSSERRGVLLEVLAMSSLELSDLQHRTKDRIWELFAEIVREDFDTEQR